MRTLENFINGRFVAPAGGETEPVLNPATGEEIAQAPLSTETDVDAAVTAARRAFDGWSQSTPATRAEALLKLADAIEEHGEELAREEAINAGKPFSAVLNDEVPVMADNLRFFAGAARTMEGRAAGEYLEGYTSFIRREPVGVIGQIAPWNYPLMMAIWKTTLRLAELAAESFPKGVLNVITGHGDPAGQGLVDHPEVDMVSLTGSVDTGKRIAASAAATLKRVHLELGGKAPVIVFDDVSMESALETIAGTGYYNAGQDCTAATRVLASSKVYDDVVSGLSERIDDPRRHAGRGHDARTAQLGPPARARRRTARTPGKACRARHRRLGARRSGLLPRAGGARRPRAGRRADPARDLRPGDHRPALQR